MFYPESFKVTTPTDREILIALDFNAPRQLVFDAFTKPETVFIEEGDITRTTITVRYESKEARDTARRSGMEHGMAAGYNRLQEILSSMLAANP